MDDHGLWYPENSNFLKPEDVQDSEESKDENPTELLRETDVPDWDRIAQMVKISLETENRGAERGELLTASTRERKSTWITAPFSGSSPCFGRT